MKRLDSDPQYFVESLKMRTPDGTKRFGECAAPHQREWLSVLAPTFLALAAGRKPTVQRVWLEGTKGSAKDTLLAALVLWLVAFSRRQVFAQVGAAKQDQAAELEKSARTWLHANADILSQRLEVHNYSIKGRLAECEIIASEVAGSHGAKPDLLILNELHAITRWEFAENLLDNASKVADGAVIVATNAGSQGTDAWKLREIARTEERWKFLQFAQPAPWISKEELAEAEKRCKVGSRFRRLFWGEWASAGMGDAFDPNELKRITRITPTLTREKGWVYAAGVDASVSRDDTALVVCAKHVGCVDEVEQAPRNRLLQWIDEYSDYPVQDAQQIITHGTGKIRLANVRIWKPGHSVTGKIDFDAVANEIVRLHQLLHLSAVHCDSSQTEYLVQLLRKQGINAHAVAQSEKRQEAMAEVLFTAMQNDQLDLYNHTELLADMGNAQLKESANRYRLVSPKNNKGEGTHHGDTLSALLNAVYALKPFNKVQESSVGRPLLCWP